MCRTLCGRLSIWLTVTALWLVMRQEKPQPHSQWVLGASYILIAIWRIRKVSKCQGHPEGIHLGEGRVETDYFVGIWCKNSSELELSSQPLFFIQIFSSESQLVFLTWQGHIFSFTCIIVQSSAPFCYLPERIHYLLPRSVIYLSGYTIYRPVLLSTWVDTLFYRFSKMAAIT